METLNIANVLHHSVQAEHLNFSYYIYILCNNWICNMMLHLNILIFIKTFLPCNIHVHRRFYMNVNDLFKLTSWGKNR